MIICEEAPNSYSHLTSWAHEKRRCDCPPGPVCSWSDDDKRRLGFEVEEDS